LKNTRQKDDTMNISLAATHWFRCVLALALAPDDEPQRIAWRRQYRDQCAEHIRLRFRYATLRTAITVFGGRPR
jgi:hypothetical protein